MNLSAYLAACAKDVDDALDRHLPKEEERPQTIHRAMRYAVYSGGKRLRPVLCLAAAEACGGDPARAFAPACAVELMHTYSLVHDDLPSMDDDDLRRGRPTCHRIFGEGVAVLCGDALLTEAFAVLAETPIPPSYSLRDLLKELAMTGGSRQLIGGQVEDLEGEDHAISIEDLVKIHEAKTAALLTTSLRLGAMTADASPTQLAALTRFGHALGLAFQVIDDILDVTQTTEVLGKTAGKDAAVNKSTYPGILGLEASRAEANRLTAMAREALEPLDDSASRLREIAESLLNRAF